MQILLSPTHPTNRKLLHDTYGIVTADVSGATSKRTSQVYCNHSEPKTIKFWYYSNQLTKRQSLGQCLDILPYYQQLIGKAQL